MKRITLTSLLLGALFVNAAIAVQESENSTEKEAADATSHYTTIPQPTTPTNETKNASTTPSPNPPTSPKTTTPLSTTTMPTSTTPPLTTTLKPTPTPKEYDWIVTGPNGTACILASMIVKLEFNINATQLVIPIPKNATGTGSCGKNSQTLKLVWPNNTMTFIFTLDNSTESYQLSNISVRSILSSLNETAVFSHNASAFSTNVKSSYKCTWSEPITGPLNNASDLAQGQLKITMTEVHVEAFHESQSDTFSPALICQTDASDIVPVMVGVALAFLVLVVLIVYVIGRRNSQARGYLSM